MSSRKTVGLALGSGSSRGWAHIGVIEALEVEQTIEEGYISVKEKIEDIKKLLEPA